MPNSYRVAFVIALVPVLLLTLVGCGDNRKCLEYDTDVVSTVVNGKAKTRVVTTCEKYEEPKADKK